MPDSKRLTRPIISKRQAIGLIPMCDRESRDFLQDEGLVHKVRGRDMVVLVDLEAAVRRYDSGGANDAPSGSRQECG
jgi:hypothetical protein